MQKTPFTFDVSVWELFWWSWFGASVYLLEPGAEKDPARMVEVIEQHGITTIHFVPSMFQSFLEYVRETEQVTRISSLSRVFTSGEALPLSQVREFNRLIFDKTGARLINLYGPTEATVDVTYYDCSPYQGPAQVPIGRPVDNTRIHILNPLGAIQPIGVPGEIMISGVQVAREYWRDPELTSKKFLADPFFPGERMYRSGDRGRWLMDGNVEYLGREDDQIKIRGIRIELGEIRECLASHPHLRDVAVVTQTVNDEKIIVAYCVIDTEATIEGDILQPEQTEGVVTIESIRAHARLHLPEAMIPSEVIFLNALPLTTSGKLNRKALPLPVGQAGARAELISPRNDLETRLHDIWKQVLQRDSFDVRDNFFEVGGHSLRAVALALRIFKALRIDFSVTDVYRAPTIEAQGAVISGSGSGEALNAASPVYLMNEKGRPPIFLFPPIVGYAWVFGEFARRITNATIFSFDFINDENRISLYADTIESIQPNDPIFLGGYSAGGNISFRVSRELERRGRTVASLLLIDSVRRVKPMPLSFDESLVCADFYINDPRAQQFMFDEGTRREIRELIAAYYRYQGDNIDEGSIQAPIHLLYSETTFEGIDIKESWNGAGHDPVRLYQGVGIHDEMMMLGQVERNAEIFSKIIEEARTRSFK